MPDKTLVAFFDHGELGEEMPADGGDCDEVLARFAEAGVDVEALARELQEKGTESFDASWRDLCQHINQQVKS
jgi:transaldolase